MFLFSILDNVALPLTEKSTADIAEEENINLHFLELSMAPIFLF